MPRWNDYKAEAKSRGALALELYIAQSTPAGDPAAVKENLPAHLAYQAELEASQNLVFAGPMSDESGEMMEGMGMIVYRAESFEAAQALAAADPMHISGARTYVLRRWMINEGSVQLNVKLSGQSVSLS